MSDLNIRDKIHIYLLKNGANKKTIRGLYELDGLIKYSSKKIREWGLSDIKEPTEEQLNEFTTKIYTGILSCLQPLFYCKIQFFTSILTEINLL